MNDFHGSMTPIQRLERLRIRGALRDHWLLVLVAVAVGAVLALRRSRSPGALVVWGVLLVLALAPVLLLIGTVWCTTWLLRRLWS